MNLLSRVATGTPRVSSAVVVVLLLVYFFLSSGDGFLRRMVEVVPGMTEKRIVVSIAHILDEEYRDVVADQIPVAFLGIELDREAAHIARGIHRTRAAGHRREAREYRRLLPARWNRSALVTLARLLYSSK